MYSFNKIKFQLEAIKNSLNLSSLTLSDRGRAFGLVLHTQEGTKELDVSFDERNPTYYVFKHGDLIYKLQEKTYNKTWYIDKNTSPMNVPNVLYIDLTKHISVGKNFNE